MSDVHSLVDVGTLLSAVLGTYLACRRALLDRVTAIEKDVSYIKGQIDAWDGRNRRKH